MAASKDFGQKRQRSAKPKRTPQKSTRSRKPAAKKSRLPIVKLTLTVALVAGMGTLLYKLGKVASTESPSVATSTPPKQVPKPKPATVVRQPAVTTDSEIPPQEVRTVEEPRFEFYQMLQESEVNTDAVDDAYRSTPKGEKKTYRYMLQAGSFKKHSEAEQLRAKLILMGLPNAKTSKSSGKNGTWYRVKVGPFDNRSMLNRAHDKLVKIRLQPMEIKLDN